MLRVFPVFLFSLAAFGQFTPLTRTPGLSDPYKPMDGKGRLIWFTSSTVGATSLLAAGPFSAGWGTLRNAPPEYGPQWEGFGKRYGMRLTGVATSNAMEAGIGAFIGEDPRYFRHGGGFKDRTKHIIFSSFTARNREGKTVPAYARYAAVTGSNFLSNTWRVESETSVGDALSRTAFGFLGRMSGNAFLEFWPDVHRIVFKKKP